MPVVLARIDDRLVHGQVSVGWSRFLRAQRIVVVSDECAADPVARALMEMGAPEGISFECVGHAEAARCYDALEAGKDRTIVLAASPAVFRVLAESGVALGEVNLGGLHPSETGRRLADGVTATPRDILDLEALLDRGVRIVVRPTPVGTAADLAALLGPGAGGKAP